MSYYNRFDANKQYDNIRFLAGRGYQSAEANETQNILAHKIQGIGDVLFNDGDVIESADAVIDAGTGAVQLADGKLYVRGAVRDVGTGSFTIATSGQVNIGVYVVTETVTELDDPALVDPAVGTRNYQEAGAYREKVSLVWGYAGDGQTVGDFFPVYLVEDGVLVNQTPPPQLDGVTQAIARYDREANGHYIADGLKVVALTDFETNLITNGDFPTATTGWALLNAAALTVNAGKLRVTCSTTADPGFEQTGISVTQYYAYRLKFDVQDVDTGATEVRVELYDDTDTAIFLVETLNGVTTTEGTLTFDFIAPNTGTIQARFYVVGTHDTQIIDFDNIEIRSLERIGLSVSAGVGNVNGFKVTRQTASRIVEDALPEVNAITSEPKTFIDDGDGKMTITTNRLPIQRVVDTDVTFQKTETITKGLSNGQDTLPDASVLAIVTVFQDPTTYVDGVDFQLTSGTVDWSLGGAEPASSSSYDVTYNYIGNGIVDNVKPGSFRVAPPASETIVAGSTITYDYNRKLPRYDIVSLSQEGPITYTRGFGRSFHSQVPGTPTGELLLCTVYMDWLADPDVTLNGVRAIPYSDLEDMQGQLDDLFALVAEDRLTNDTTAREPASKYGVFVDPFLDDDLRDAGEPQTGAIFGEILTLPIFASVDERTNQTDNLPWTLDYTMSPVISQTLHSGWMKVNPYQAFDPIPAELELVPRVDSWVTTNVTWNSSVTRRITTFSSLGLLTRTSVRRSVQVTARRTVEAETMRIRDIDFSIKGLDAGEILDELTFDGIPLTMSPAAPVADGTGLATGTFTIPANQPTGRVQVTVTGDQGNRGEATFISRGQITTEERRAVTVQVTERFDPLAQTFTLGDDRHVGGVDVIFEAKGAGNDRVTAQIRTTQVGFPTQDVLAEGSIYPADITADGISWTTINFKLPAFLQADREYCVVLLTDNADHAVRVAELGKYDSANSKWITSQPYQVGVLLSSSNASTWTAHQSKDLTFRLLAADFTSANKTIALGNVAMTDVSDIIASAGVERPGAITDAKFRFTLGADVIDVTDGQVVNLQDRLTGSVQVDLILDGSSTLTPVVFPDIQNILGNLQDTGTYVSRAIPSNNPCTITVIIDGKLPGTATLTVEAEGPADSWTNIPNVGSTAIDDGYTELEYEITGFALAAVSTRIRLTFTGSPLYRPEFQKLRVIIK